MIVRPLDMHGLNIMDGESFPDIRRGLLPFTGVQSLMKVSLWLTEFTRASPLYGSAARSRDGGLPWLALVFRMIVLQACTQIICNYGIFIYLCSPF